MTNAIDWNQVNNFMKLIDNITRTYVPNDIKWVVEDIGDKVSDYVYECEMYGESEKTNKCYRGQATVCWPMNNATFDDVVDVEEIKETIGEEDE